MMHFRFIRSAAVLSSAVVAVSAAGAQSPAPAVQPLAMSQEVVPPTLAVFTGAFGFNFVITISQTLPVDYPITCAATVSPIDAGAIYTSETKTVTAVRSGSTATCSFAIHYAWSLSSGSDMVNTHYTVSTVGTSTSLVDRFSTAGLPSIALPVNGGSVSRVINVTI